MWGWWDAWNLLSQSRYLQPSEHSFHNIFVLCNIDLSLVSFQLQTTSFHLLDESENFLFIYFSLQMSPRFDNITKSISVLFTHEFLINNDTHYNDWTFAMELNVEKICDNAFLNRQRWSWVEQQSKVGVVCWTQ
jgi:hypothetical protein